MIKYINKPVESWVVYESVFRGKPAGLKSVCEQREWEAMERLQPGAHPVIQAGIKTEGEAEQLARLPLQEPTKATQ